MDLSPMYGDGARQLQDHFDSRRLADRLTSITLHTELNDSDIALIEAQSSVIISTVDADGWPDLSYKGGDRGFVRVVDPSTLELPSFDGNGMFRTLGNITDTGKVALLFIDTTIPFRMRLHGTAVVLTDAETIGRYVGAQAVVRINLGRIFPNCGRYVHSADQISEYVPRSGHEPPEPEWKSYPTFAEVLPNPSDG
jgi:uncharacterized protein